MTHPHRIVVLVVFAAALALGGYFGLAPGQRPLSPVMAVGVSSDGRYVVSSHRKNELVLWDIGKRQHVRLASDANIYSAQFVPGRHAILWQDLNDVVRVQTTEGTVFERFVAPPAYSHAISTDLTTYVSTDEAWGLWRRAGNGPVEALKQGDSGSFLGLGKPLNVELGPDADIALLAGFGAYFHRDGLSILEQREHGFIRFDGVAVWDLGTGEPRHNLPGNRAKTHATLSPDGQHVVSVDENLGHYLWHTDSGERAYEVSTIGSGLWQPSPDPDELGSFDASGVRIEFPEDFDTGYHSKMLAVQFLDEDYYAGFHPDEPYASLWRLGEPHALRMLDLGTDPFPATDSYARNAAIDAAPKANVLVTGQRSGGGINVYRFDPERQTLQRIWAPEP